LYSAAEKSHGAEQKFYAAAEKSHGAGQKFYAAAELQSATSIFQFFNSSRCGLGAGVSATIAQSLHTDNQ